MSKVTALTELTTPVAADLLYIIDDPGGTATSKKITIGNVLGTPLGDSSSFGWSDVLLNRDAANSLAVRNSTNAQTFSVYNTYTDASNYERGVLKFDSNVLKLCYERAGTGVDGRTLEICSDLLYIRDQDASFILMTASTSGVEFNAKPLPFSAGSQSLGQGSRPWKDIFLRPSSSLTPTSNGDLVIEATNNTTITFKLKGSDGTVRSGTLTLS